MSDVFVFSYDDYKAYVNAYIASQPKKGYGFKSRMAQAADCKTAYVAQVLNGSAHLSLEQAEALNPLFNHNEDQSDFFLLLVQMSRAGTERLRKRLKAQMKVLRDRQTNLKQRFKVQNELSASEVLEYFSRWALSATHIATTIPRMKKRENLKKYLGIDEVLLKETLDFLIAKGLVVEADGKLEPGQTKIFAGKDSGILKMHHANWRQKAVQFLDHERPEDVHFTAVYSLSTEDAARIRERLIREIEAVRKIVGPSAEEELHAFTLDFFRIDRETK